tara:strand:- start:137 stop:388 length:252 start_codon:yes stop_codon:yes gene_type:complete
MKRKFNSNVQAMATPPYKEAIPEVNVSNTTDTMAKLESSFELPTDVYVHPTIESIVIAILANARTLNIGEEGSHLAPKTVTNN